MTTIAILGANGRIAHAVAKAFHHAGYSVIAVTRGGHAHGLPVDVQQRAADALDRGALIAATAGADLVFNGLSPLYTEWEKVMPMAENVVSALAAHRAVQLFTGTVYNYGREIPPIADETTPFHGSTEKGAIRIAMEGLFARAARDAGVRTIVLRAGDFFGGDRPGAWFDMVIAKNLAKGTVTYPGPLLVDHAWAYLPDLARTFVRLAEHRSELAPFAAFTFEGHTLTGEALIGHVEAAMGQTCKRAGMPWPLIRAVGLFKPMWRELAIMSYLWFTPHRLSGARLSTLIGAVPHTPAGEAVRQAIADIGALRKTDARAA